MSFVDFARHSSSNNVSLVVLWQLILFEVENTQFSQFSISEDLYLLEYSSKVLILPLIYFLGHKENM